MHKINKERYNIENNLSIFSKWITGLFLFFSILMLAYIYYRAEIYFLGMRSNHYYKYYIISMIGVLFWTVVLTLKKKLQFNIVLVTISLVIGLYITEGLLIFFEKINYKTRTEIAAELGIEYDSRTKSQVIQDLKSKGVAAVSTYHPAVLLENDNLYKNEFKHFFPLSGQSRKTTVYDNESGVYSIYFSDRYGFNNPDSEWDSSQIDWLLIGDSFTHGSAVQPGEDIAGQIRLMTGNPVINLGIGGNGPLVELATFKEYATSLRPKKVLWVFYEGNDLENIKIEKSWPIFINYLQDSFSQNLINNQHKIDKAIGYFLKEIKTRYNINEKKWTRLSKVRQLLLTSNDEPNIDPIFKEILTAAKAKTESWGGQFYFVYLPGFTRYNTQVNHIYYKNKDKVIDIVKSLNIPIIDIHKEVFSDHSDPLSLFPLRIYSHYNAAGYNKVAEAIVKKIKE